MRLMKTYHSSTNGIGVFYPIIKAILEMIINGFYPGGHESGGGG